MVHLIGLVWILGTAVPHKAFPPAVVLAGLLVKSMWVDPTRKYKLSISCCKDGKRSHLVPFVSKKKYIQIFTIGYHYFSVKFATEFTLINVPLL